ncbi:hypothetical protein GCM10027034_11410 [Ramlibacter solisilvae]|uniref:DUF4124 domain-containing protein n=1 Tax=Ramlibacter tataouinensis TaxID=94132 RepID=A0A127JXF0_9BURK|nr:hypothetical protein [Ramlibacter tataouinensis]AMO24569.1 hypothetical protein UC35_19125 [Ramlibacter tataouinensis]
MGRSKSVLLVPLLALAPLQALACYTVYDRADRVVYHGDKPPVDMSRPLHETVPERFPGGHMVFDAQQCPVLSSVAYGAGGPDLATASPLLTDERTARAMKAPYERLGRGVVLVRQPDARMAPGVSVLPAYRPPAARGPVREPALIETEPAQPQPGQPRY